MNNRKKFIEEQKNKLDILVQNQIVSITMNPDKLDPFLEQRAILNKFSAKNTLAIMGQRDNAKYVASSNQFNKMGIPVRKGQGQYSIKVYIPVKSYYITVSDKNININNITSEQQQLINTGEVLIKEGIQYSISTMFDITQTICSPKLYPKYIGKNYENYQKEIEKAIELVTNEPNKNFIDVVNLLNKSDDKLENNCISKMLYTHFKVKEPEYLKEDRRKSWSEFAYHVVERAAEEEREEKNSSKLDSSEFQKKTNNIIIAYLDNITNHYHDIAEIINEKFNEVIQLAEKNKPKNMEEELKGLE